MFKYIILVVGVISMFGCSVDLNNPLVVETKFNNHSYLVFRVASNFGQTYVHNPDCSCYK